MGSPSKIDVKTFEAQYISASTGGHFQEDVEQMCKNLYISSAVDIKYKIWTITCTKNSIEKMQDRNRSRNSVYAHDSKNRFG